jgi:thiosulfate/3-mercaptopyruvate sulfurtransferase
VEQSLLAHNAHMADVFNTLISADELQRRLGAPGWNLVDWRIVDCRFELANTAAGRRAYAAGHIPGAVYAHLDDDLSGPVTPQSGRHPLPRIEQFAATLGRFGIASDAQGNETQVICYDDSSGAIAARLWWMLRWLGHTRVAVLDGGMKAWKEAGYAVEQGQAALPAAARFEPRAHEAWLTTPAVEAALSSGSIALVDARAGDRFEGRNETIDSRAGHIPGALSHPYASNVDATGRFLPAAELRRRWSPVLDRGGEIVSMCGSGVTACHNLLALEVAGLPPGRLYAGSWSEWIRDPRRPVAVGPDTGPA